MELKLNDNWRETSAINTFTGKVWTTGYEWCFSNVTGAGV